MTTDLPERSWLFTPATRPDRFDRAAAAGADVLIIDLEDAVAVSDKDMARQTAVAYLESSSCVGLSHALRINALDTVAGIADLHRLLASAADPTYVILPKTESAAHLRILDTLLRSAGKSSRLVGLVESARGLAACDGLAAATPRLAGLMFGAADMAADLGAELSWEPLAAARARLVAACAITAIAAIDAPYFDMHDGDGLAIEVRRAIAAGFRAKAAIHPSQIQIITAALTPSAEAVEQALRVIAANLAGVGVVDGRMIDEAIARKARRTLAAAHETI